MRSIVLLGLMAVIFFLVSGCYSSVETSQEIAQAAYGQGVLVLRITDAPKDLEGVMGVFVTLSDVEVHNSAYDKVSEAGWSTIVDQPQTFDLLLIKDVKELLGSASLEVGKYTQLRLNVEKAWLIFDDESSYDLKIPPEKIMLVHPFDIEEGQQTELLLDFDAEKSIHKTGKETYTMNPVIKIIPG